MFSTAQQYARLPGLFRQWDLQFIPDRESEYHIHFDSLTDDQTPLFVVYRRTARVDTEGQP